MKTHVLGRLLPAIMLLSGILHAAQPPAGSSTVNLPFAINPGTGFVDRTFDNYQDCILVVMMMTPWCPFCQTNSVSVGDGILDFFAASTRGALQGKNDHGIPIRSILLSTEPTGYDSSASSHATTNGYQQWGLDANALRQNPRTLLGHFRGGFPNGVNSSNLYDWGNDRRRVVVLNMVNGSASHDLREILINQNFFDSTQYATARTAINSVQPALTYAAWAAGFSFPPGESDPDDDADRDGVPNGIEAFLGTHPRQSGSRSLPTASLNHNGGTHLEYVFRRAQSVPSDLVIEVQVSLSLESGSWTTIKRMSNGVWSGTATLTEGLPADSRISVTVETHLPAADMQFVRLKANQS